MYKVKALQDFGTWCRKGREYNLGNSLAEGLAKKGVLELLEYLGKASTHDNKVAKSSIEKEIRDTTKRMKPFILQLERLNRLLKEFGGTK